MSAQYTYSVLQKRFELSQLVYGISHTNRAPLKPLAHPLVCVCFSPQAAVMKCSAPAAVQQCAMHDKELEIAGKAWGTLCDPAGGTNLQATSHAGAKKLFEWQ